MRGYLKLSLLCCVVSFLVRPGIALGVSLSVPFLSQVPPGIWEETRNCGPVSLLMVDAYLSANVIDQNSIVQIDDWMFLNMGRDRREYNGDYTNTADLQKLAVEYLSIPEEGVEIKKGNGELDDLKLNLDAGNPLIVGVYTNMKTNVKRKDVKHFMVLTGIDDQYVYVNDPGKTRGENNKYTIDQFKIAWAGNNYAYIVFKKNEVVPAVEEPPIPSSTPDTSVTTSSKPPFYVQYWQKLSTFVLRTMRWVTTFSSGDYESRQDEVEVIQESVDQVQQATEVQMSEPVFDAVFAQTQITITTTPGQREVTVPIVIRNSGTAQWGANTLSLNVVGGLTLNAPWYHQSWATRLRPVALKSGLDAGATASLPVTITIPVNQTQFRLQLVRVGPFTQVGSSIVTVVLQYEQPPVLPEVVESRSEHTSGSEMGVDHVDETVSEQEDDTVVESQTDISPVVVRSSGGSSSVDEDNSVEDEVVTSTPEDVTTSTEPLPSLSNLVFITPEDVSSTWYSSLTTVTLAGESDEYTQMVVVEYEDEVFATTSPADGLWEIPLTFTTGTHMLAVYGTASEERQTSSTMVTLIVDTEAPAVDIQLQTVEDGAIVVELTPYDDTPVTRYIVEFFEVTRSYADEEPCREGEFSFDSPIFSYFIEGDQVFVEFDRMVSGCGFVTGEYEGGDTVWSHPYDDTYPIAVRARGVDSAANESGWWYSAVSLYEPYIPPGDPEL